MKIDIDERESFLIEQAVEEIIKYKGKLETVLDIGAHVGVFTLKAIELGAKKVYAIEPTLDSYKKLINNIIDNNLGGKIIPLPFAITNKDYEVRIIKHNGLPGQNSLYYKTGVEFLTSTISFTTLLKLVGHIDYCKIDIEGAEWEIFNFEDEELSGLIKNIGFLEIELHGISAPEKTDEVKDNWPGMDRYLRKLFGEFGKRYHFNKIV